MEPLSLPIVNDSAKKSKSSSHEIQPQVVKLCYLWRKTLIIMVPRDLAARVVLRPRHFASVLTPLPSTYFVLVLLPVVLSSSIFSVTMIRAYNR